MLKLIIEHQYDFPDKYGKFYFGQASIPIKVCDGVYQIKCLYRRQETSKYFDVVYLQFEKDSYDIKFLDTLRNNYISSSRGKFYLTDNYKVFSIIELDKAQIVTPSKYDAKNMNSIYHRLQKMSIQMKPVIK